MSNHGGVHQLQRLSLIDDWNEYIFKNPCAAATAGKVKTKLGVDFVVASAEVREVEVEVKEASTGEQGTLRVQVKQLLGSDYHVLSGSLGVGAVVWDAGDVMGKFITKFDWLVKGKTVIDLGSGTGIAGIIAGVAGAREVYLTDHESLRELCMHNVRETLQAVEEYKGEGYREIAQRVQNIKFEEFWWGGGIPQKIRQSMTWGDEHFDVILASDDLYDKGKFSSLPCKFLLLL